MALALEARNLEVADSRGCRSTNGRRERGGENETRRIAAHRIDERGAPRDVTSQAAERLGQCSLDYVQPGHRALLLSLTTAAGAVHSHGMHLVRIRHGPVVLGQAAEPLDRRPD